MPNNVEQALHFNRLNRNKAWKEAIEKEMNSLNKLTVFDYKSPKNV